MDDFATGNARHDGGERFLELRSLGSVDDVQGVTGSLSRLIQAQLNATSDFAKDIAHTLGEVADNIFHHCDSPFGGLICAQTYPMRDEVELAIADCGRGILQSLSQRYQVSSDAEAIRLALQKGITGTDHGQNTGNGLFITKRFIESNRGLLQIYSGACRYQWSGGTEYFLEDQPYWQGTLVTLVFNTRNPINAIDIFAAEYPKTAEEVLQMDDWLSEGIA